jgi:membrane-associated protein
MQFLHWFQENFLHLDKSLAHLVADYGTWSYLILFLIIFCETGLVVTPFLPGDALLFALGAFVAVHAGAGLSYSLLLLLLASAAILGNLVNYSLGGVLGSRIFKEKALILKKAYLEKTHVFFEKHGPKAIILARFLPLFRTLVPFVAGIGKMNWHKFFLYNIVGSLLWVVLMMTCGLWFGRIPWVQAHFESVVIGVIAVSMIPVVVEGVTHWVEAKKRH